MSRKRKSAQIKPRKLKYGELKYRYSRVMPKALQIYTYKRIFLSANADLEDPEAEMENVDWESVIDDTLTFGENRQNLEENYPQYSWESPKEERKHKWQSEYSDDSVVYTTEVAIKPHEVKREYDTQLQGTKSRNYRHGRIQVTVDERWIGHKAKISVRIPAKTRKR